LRYPLLFAVAYFAAAEAGHLFSFPGNFASFWPPSGVYLATLLLADRRRWPLFIIAATIGNVCSDVGFHDKTVWVSLGFCVANMLEAVVASLLLRRMVGTPFSLSKLSDVGWFLVATMLLGTAIGAGVGAFVVSTAFGAPYWTVWWTWWMSGVMGILLLTPGIVNFVTIKPWQEPGQSRRLLEAIGFMIVTAAASEYIFGWQTETLAYAVLPIIFCAALRLRVCGAVLTTFVLTGITVWHTIHGDGPFVGETPIPVQMGLTQGFLGVSIVVSLLLAVLRMEGIASAKQTAQALQDLEQANAELQRLAATDALTGLYNQGAYQSKLDEEVGRGMRHHTALALILIDVDHFKSFNDEFGHPAGDVVLKEVARLISQSVRVTDFVARCGGEEFTVLLPYANTLGAMAVAERIRNVIADATWDLRAITISVGVSALGSGVSNKEMLVKSADLALYESKSQGRNCTTSSESIECCGENSAIEATQDRSVALST